MSKFNPDVLNNMKKNNNLRNCSTYDLKKQFYNPITNKVPNKINNQNDLKLKSDKPTNLNRLLQSKINERNEKIDFKKKKIVQNNYGINHNSFNQLKRMHQKLENKRNSKKTSNNQVIQSLKDLGIFN